MPLKTRPLGNNVLIEVQREYDGVSRADENESLKVGRVVNYRVFGYHLTASAAIKFEDGFAKEMAMQLDELIGELVRWEEFAEGGQTFTEDGKLYALVPWWRLISFTDEDNGTQ